MNKQQIKVDVFEKTGREIIEIDEIEIETAEVEIEEIELISD
jgi:hypothetical protein